MSDLKPAAVAPSLDVRIARLVAPGGPFELCPQDGALVFKAKPHTLVELFLGLGRREGRECVAAGALRLTYGTFLRRAKWGACALEGLGVRPGDRVAIAMESGVEWMLAFASTVLAGAVAVLLPPGPDAAGRAGAARCALILSDPEAWAAQCAGEGEPPYSPIAAAPWDEVMIACTSGTSGPPKQVLIDHRGILSGLRNMMLGGALAALRKPARAGPASGPATPCVLLMAPLHHVAGYGQFLLMLMLGGRVVLPSGVSASAIIDQVEAEKATSIVGLLPELILDLVRAPVARSLASLGSITFYGAPPPAALASRLKQVIPHAEIGAGYGMTETNGSIAVASQHDLAARPGVAGMISPAVRTRVVGDDGCEAGPGEEGELWVSGPFLAKGYLDPAPGRSSAFQDGWLRTGDRGRIDAEGFLFLAEPEDERIQVGRREVACVALEQAAFRHPAVKDAAAFRLDPATPERAGVLALVLQPGVDWAGLSGRLAADPDCGDVRLVWMPEIPRTASGKIDRRRLRRDFATSAGDYCAGL